MILEKPKVKWPSTIALLVPASGSAYEMRFVEDRSVYGETKLNSDRKVSQVPITQAFECKVIDAYYLARIYVRLLSGAALPKGKLTATLDDEIIAQGELSAFLLPEEPVNCETVLPFWKEAETTYRAVPMIDAHNCDKKHLIGFMITNNMRLVVKISEVAAQEKVTLETGALISLYSTKAAEKKG